MGSTGWRFATTKFLKEVAKILGIYDSKVWHEVNILLR